MIPKITRLSSKSLTIPLVSRSLLNNQSFRLLSPCLKVSESRLSSTQAAVTSPKRTKTKTSREIPGQELLNRLETKDIAKIAAFTARAGISLSPQVLIIALTHASTNMVGNNGSRLALLGKSLLNLTVTETVLLKYPFLPPLAVESIVENLAGRTAVFNVANILDVRSVMRWNPTSKQNPELGIESVSGSVVHALIGALYQEKGTKIAKEFIATHFSSRQINIIAHLHNSISDPRRTLRKLIGSLGLPPPVSRLLQETGRLSTAPVFIVGIYVGDKKIGEANSDSDRKGYGSSLQIAEILAAKTALETHYAAEASEFNFPDQIGEEFGPNLPNDALHFTSIMDKTRQSLSSTSPSKIREKSNFVHAIVQQQRTSRSSGVHLKSLSPSDAAWDLISQKALEFDSLVTKVPPTHSISISTQAIQTKNLLDIESQSLKTYLTEKQKVDQAKIQQLKSKNEKIEKDIEECISQMKAQKLQIQQNYAKIQKEEEEKIKREVEQKQMDDLRKNEALEKQRQQEYAEEVEQNRQRQLILRQNKQTEDRARNIANQMKVSDIAIENSVISEKAWNEYNVHYARLLKYKVHTKLALKANQSTWMWLWKKKQEIRKRVGQLNETADKQRETIDSFLEIIQEAKSRGANEFEGVLKKISKSIVRQAETEISVKFDLAKPWATVCVNLFSKIPEFLDFMIGTLMQRCIYIVPRYARRLPNQTVQEYQKSTGYRSKNGVCKLNPDDYICEHPGCVELEEERAHNERMIGLVALYAAIVTLKINEGNPYGLRFGWLWLARICNMKPRRITPLLLIAGQDLLDHFGVQVKKLLRFIPKMWEVPAAESSEPSRIR
ncbi:hypothetical protein HK096_003790, partial [Nowakowskiella sp. JEL0078]